MCAPFPPLPPPHELLWGDIFNSENIPGGVRSGAGASCASHWFQSSSVPILARGGFGWVCVEGEFGFKLSQFLLSPFNPLLVCVREGLGQALGLLFSGAKAPPAPSLCQGEELVTSPSSGISWMLGRADSGPCEGVCVSGWK